MTLTDLFAGEPQLVPAALRGYRTWDLHPPTGALASTGMPNVWGLEFELARSLETAQRSWMGSGDTATTAHLFGKLASKPEVARCMRNMGCLCGMCTPSPPSHEAPGAGCTCGIYGWYSPADTRIVSARIFGAIQASGRVILGTHGFRAERAEVLALASSGHDQVDRTLRTLGYQVMSDRGALLEQYPPQDMSSLIDHRCDGGCTRMSGSMTVSMSPGAAAAVQHLLSTSVLSPQAVAQAFGVPAAVVGLPTPPPRRPPTPRWKRWPAVAASAAGVATTAFGLGLSGWHFAAHPRWSDVAAAAVDAAGVFLWRRLLVKAWRWR